MGCGCNKGRSQVVRNQQVAASRVVLARNNPTSPEVNNMADQDFIMIKYVHPNRGNHPVIGAQTRTKYGVRKSGDTFLVDRRDVVAQRHLFEPLQDKPIPAPPSPPIKPPVPVAVGWGEIDEKFQKILIGEGFESMDDLRGIPESQLLAIKGIGKATAKKIVGLLS